MSGDTVDPRHIVMHTLYWFVGLAAALLALGGLGHVLVFETAIGEAELEWTRWVADHRVGLLDSLATIGSALSDTWTVIGMAFGASSMLWAAGRRSHACVLPLGLALELTVFLSVSTLVGRERPDVTPLGSVPSTSSFPSGHVAAAVVLYGGLALIAASLRQSRAVSRVGAVLAAVAVAFVASARVYEGVHHPSDVIGGAVLGAGALLAAGLISGTISVRAQATGAPDAEQSSVGVGPPC